MGAGARWFRNFRSSMIVLNIWPVLGLDVNVSTRSLSIPFIRTKTRSDMSFLKTMESAYAMATAKEMKRATRT